MVWNKCGSLNDSAVHTASASTRSKPHQFAFRTIFGKVTVIDVDPDAKRDAKSYG